MPSLLARDEFRNAVFARDGHKCVVCKAPAQDAHHVLERRLWLDGGYHLDNGVSVCGHHHLLAESTELSCDELRGLAGITKVVLPEHLYEGDYDKWGNPILPNGTRLKGELFHDESVQKVLAPVLHMFVDKVKHPRTYHLPWSEGATDDDKTHESTEQFVGREVVATLKMDGEQTTMYRDGFHARSLDTPSHPSRNWLWSILNRIGHEIPPGWRVCGENLFAKHTIHYHNLPDLFLVHSIWDDKNVCLSWAETAEWAQLLELQTVQILYKGPWSEQVVRGVHQEYAFGDECEGYVVRVADAFPYRDYRRLVGKYVRANFVPAHAKHWAHQEIVKNEVCRD